MKIGIFKGSHTLHLLVETEADCKAYQDIYMSLTSKKNVQSIFGFASQDFRKDFDNYLAHEGLTVAPETRVLALEMSLSGKSQISFIEMCGMSDKIMIDKYLSICRIVDEGKICRLNTKGGMCPITQEDFEDFEEVIDITGNGKILNSFLINGKIDVEDIIIKGTTIIIENSSKAEDKFLDWLSDLGITNPQIINNFKMRTVLWKDEDFFNILKEGINQGLKNICIETTGQDYRQIDSFNNLLATIFKLFPNLDLNLYLKTYNQKVKTSFNHPNLTVIHN